jgi:ATP-binding cassette, subfamily C, bacterial
MYAKALAAWNNSDVRMYVATLIETMRWKVALALTLTLCRSVTQGAQVLLLVPLMQLVGLDVEQGPVSWIAELVASVFAAVGVPLTLITVLGTFLLITAGLELITSWQTTFNARFEQDFIASLRHRLYRAVAKTEWLTFARSRLSDFTHALTTEIERVGNATVYLMNGVTNAILAVVYLLLALRLSLAMSALVFVSGGVLLLWLRRREQGSISAGADISSATQGLYATCIEHLASMKLTKSYGVEERSAAIFSGLADRVAQMILGAARHHARTTLYFGLGSAVILTAALFVSLEILGLSAAALLLLLLVFSRTVPLLQSSQFNYHQFLNELPAFSRVMEIQAWCEAAVEPEAEQQEEVKLQDGIRFEEVTFAHDGEGGIPAVVGLDLKIRAGETTAIVGPSGAGKSTVVDLALGLIMPNRGRVLVDEVPLGPERVRSWRDQIGYVAQDTFLFHDTVRANLLWACPEANDEEIEQALRLAAAEEFVSELPEGMETVLGDRGVRLSGGERQRLALARALLRKPSFLILDEATSALDSENEKRIQSAVDELRGHTTILIIAHRLSTIRGADVIYVLEQGHLVESGDWDTLLDKESGRFAALCRAQGVDQ